MVKVSGYAMCGGTFVTMVFMMCGQFDMLYASLKNLNKAASNDDLKLVELFRFY